MLSQGPAVHCIVMGRNSGHIHFQGGGWQPTLQPFLQERKHYSNRASSGVFSARRTPVREQTPLQYIGLPCRRSSSLSDGLYHRLWETTQVCRVPSRSHTWRFHRSGRGCQMVPSPWERKSFLRGMGQGGAVAGRMSSGNQVRVGQNGATSRTCSSSSLTLHSVCASRLTGGMHTCIEPEASCVPVRPCRGCPRSGRKPLAVGGLARSKQVTWASPNRLQISRIVSGWSRHSPGKWAVVRARRPHDWAPPECGQRAAIWAACDSRGGDGGRAVTCGVIVYPPSGWYTTQPQCCPYGPTHACLTAVAETAARLDALPAALGSWCAKAVEAPSRAPRLPSRCM